MKEFTAQQKEVIARKLGYDGPMAGFDDFIASSPALSMKYAAISDKFAQRMAKGGMLKKKKKGYNTGSLVTADRFTTDQYKGAGEWLAANINNPTLVAETVSRLGLSNEEVLRAAQTVNPNITLSQVQSFLPAASGSTNNANATTTGTTTTGAATTGATTTGAATTDSSAATTGAATTGATTTGTATTGAATTGAATTGAGATTAADTKRAGHRFTDAQYAAAGQWIQQNLSNPNIVAQKVIEMGLSDGEVLEAARTVNPNITLEQVRAYLASGKITTTTGGSNTITGTTTTGTTTTGLNLLNSVFSGTGKTFTAEELATLYRQLVGREGITEADFVTAATRAGATGSIIYQARALLTQGADNTRNVSNVGRPLMDAFSAPVASTITSTTEQKIGTANRAGTAETTTAQQAMAETALAPSTITPSLMTAKGSSADLATALSGFKPAAGAVSEKAQVTAAQMAPETTELMDIEAAQGVARQITGAPVRTLGTGELVSGTAVDQVAVERALKQAEAAQGTVTEEMTVQGQLNKLMKDFDAKNPPPWAASSLRATTATLTARGLGASSLAGQALIQATLESAIPIAAADADVFKQMGLQNLSNRQQTAMLVAQQRAQFLGQEFDQAFQTRVLNAAKVADVANMNFTAQQQIAIENARLAQSMDLANLNNDQAVVMAQAAQIATLETANLNNRQQAAVTNAQAFLQIDMANLSNEQQTTLFKAQATTQALLSDTAAQNAAAQFNATSANQVNQFNATLSTQVSQFNAAQKNAISQFNSEQSNVIGRFNAEQKNLREQFNAQQRLVIDQANAQWEREIATVNTAARNASNLLAAQLVTNMTIAEYNNEVQMYRDQINQIWQSAENDAARATSLAAAEISSNAAISAAAINAAADVREAEISAAARVTAAATEAEGREDAAESAAWGNIAVKVFGELIK